jgi:hypothetical protein
VELTSCHRAGAGNFKVASRFLENLRPRGLSDASAVGLLWVGRAVNAVCCNTRQKRTSTVRGQRTDTGC